MEEVIQDDIRKQITDAYYDARNAGQTMETAADNATNAVMALLEQPRVLEEPVTTGELWDAVPGPTLIADYVPALDGTAAVKGPSDAHPELRLAREGYGDLEARLTAIIGSVDGEAYVSRIVAALIAAGVRFEHSNAP